MRAARLSVHFCCAGGTITVSEAHKIVNLLLAVNILLADILKVNAFIGFLLYSDIVFCGVDQVLDPLVVDF